MKIQEQVEEKQEKLEKKKEAGKEENRVDEVVTPKVAISKTDVIINFEDVETQWKEGCKSIPLLCFCQPPKSFFFSPLCFWCCDVEIMSSIQKVIHTLIAWSCI